MKNEFDDLNGIENDLDIEEIVLSEEEKEDMRKRVMSKVNKPKKKSKKKMIMAASLCLALGGSFALTNESVMAAVERMGKSLESFFEVEELDYKPYKKEILKEVEDKGIKFILNEAILDDEELYISTRIDYSSFDTSELKEPITGKYNIIVDGIKEVISSEGRKIERCGSGASYNYNDEEKIVDILLSIDVEDEKRFENIYDIKLNIPSMTLQKKGAHEKVLGNWDIEFQIDGSKIAKEVKSVEVNKEIEFVRDGKKRVVNISEFRKSPISITMDYQIIEGFNDVLDEREEEESYEIGFRYYDQNGEKLDFVPQGGGGAGDIFETGDRWIIDREITKIKVVPIMIHYSKGGYNNVFKNIKLKDQAFEIEIK